MSNEILLLNGPNLNLLGTRETDMYGDTTLEDVENLVSSAAEAAGYSVRCAQSNVEGELVDALQAASNCAGVLLNAGAYTHTSVALRDAIKGAGAKVVEIHISNVFQREDFRHVSMIGPVCIGSVSGFGIDSYLVGLQALIMANE